ncbi:Calcium-transporting ATPase 8 plasma membrane-type [Bienertia sinuspersici]
MVFERLKKQAALVLNASRRFRYTLDLKREEEKKEIIRKIRTHAQVVRAANLFKEAAEKAKVTQEYPDASGDYGISQEELAAMSKDHDLAALQQLGGVTGLAEKLKSNLEKGIPENDENILQRKNVFGSNTYPRKKGRSFWRFLWEACQDLTLVILMVAAVASLALGIKSEGIKEGWYDGGKHSLCGHACYSCYRYAISDYRQSLQFQNLNDEKRNIHLEVVRGGRRVEISIFDIVVGDIIPLKIGDQVPADGVLVSGQSLAIDESSMTGESKIVTKDSKSPFLMSGCKVADGYGTMLMAHFSGQAKLHDELIWFSPPEFELDILFGSFSLGFALFVTSVGINTEWGMLMASISEDTGEETPLQVRLNGLATFIGIAGLTVAFVVLVVLLARFFSGHTKNPNGSPEFQAGKTSVSHAIDGAIKIVTVAVTIVVVAVPEGLPLAVTLTLAYSMRKMMRDKALVRRLSACETMGSATTICSDKTGTLTLNQARLCSIFMTVVEAYANGKKLDPPNDGSLLHPTSASLIIEGIAQNTTGCVFLPEGGGDIEISGSPTEKAILSWGVKLLHFMTCYLQLGMNFDAKRSESTIIHAFPFNSEKKRGGVAVKTPGSEVHVHWKGAAEIVLASCASYMDENDSVAALDEPKLAFFKKAIGQMASQSLRCVAIAYIPYKLDSVPSDEDQLSQWVLPEDDLILLAIVGIKDPCRPGVRNSVELCKAAGVKEVFDHMVVDHSLENFVRGMKMNSRLGVWEEGDTRDDVVERGDDGGDMGWGKGWGGGRDGWIGGWGLGMRYLWEVRMVTGDNLQTAKAIALECGILASDADANEPNLIEGKSFREKTETEREEIAEKISVMGRSSPNDKLLLVQALKRKGHVVAVTGDGTNDAPALHEADIGLAMGIAGTEVAKESSDIIILDDNFASVVKVVRWGRSVYANIQKFIQFQLTVNVAALFINVVAAFSTGEVPLNAVQLLWVNLIMDTLGALALATEPPTDHLMHRPPVGRRFVLCIMKEPLITNIMWRNLIIQAVYQIIVLLVLNFEGRNILHLRHDPTEHANKVKNTVIFNAFVLCQIFNEFNARKPDQLNIFEGVIKNKLFMGIIALTIILQIVIVEFLGKFAKTVKLNWQLWLVCVVIGLISWPLAVLGKLIPVPKTPLSKYLKCSRFRQRSRHNSS